MFFSGLSRFGLGRFLFELLPALGTVGLSINAAFLHLFQRFYTHKKMPVRGQKCTFPKSVEKWEKARR